MTVIRSMGHGASRRRALFSSILLLGVTAPLAAQTDPRLQDVVRLAQEGNGDSARSTANRLIAQLSPTDTLYPQALYTLGLVSRSVDEMRKQYSRVAVEYANSDWADDALVRLGMLDYAAGNPQGTLNQMTKVQTDYPTSPMLGTAAFWAARAAFDVHRPSDACRWISTGLANVGSDVELKNQLDFYSGRCMGGMAAESSRADTVRPPARAGYGVQVGAVTTQAAADKLISTLKAAGIPGYVAKEGSSFKVRAGPYADRNAAQAALPKVKAAAGGSPFVVKEP